ncbi:UDP-3-O-acyl-N-acetylglucosamine deacetylase [Rhodobium gokarnense]|uniref:UDP-3-O-acyl-N-acetylglucosamine deacetylase n=1 Tax=Rhodobium gokarnense TaxID=364296 RepID=A0ABT3H9E7_9HYPH|nr:UDP-3-O-acyl-N-acetylglucosamine deacetylase [Rhodobium gokarnense]MCW2307027.1 UDP-3-O-[3-hydroxymyristoyl] N-acetylglucosamine deacetylase [Rhodobium gokarnense]
MKRYNNRHKGELQTTLAEAVTLSDIGVHCGQPVSITLTPADPDSGIVFQLSHPKSGAEVEIEATWQSVAATELCTVIASPCGASVATIEHLMATFRGLGVDNVVVEIDGPEVPVMDGSSGRFVDAIEQVGLVASSTARRYLQVLKPVRVDRGDCFGEFLPHDGCRFDITIDFDTPLIGRQRFDAELTPEVFRDQLSRARTFGYLRDVEKLWSMGYALGSSLENSVAIADDRILNPEGVRWPDEFVRHKALDAVGDLALAGMPILGLYRSYKGGHKLNYLALKALIEDASAWRVVEKPSRGVAGHADVATFVNAPLLGPDVS